MKTPLTPQQALNGFALIMGLAEDDQYTLEQLREEIRIQCSSRLESGILGDDAHPSMRVRISPTARIEVTELKDYAIWGTWSGDQNAASDLIRALPGAHDLGIGLQLFRDDGRAAGDNTSEGTFTIDAKLKEWDAIHELYQITKRD